MTPWVAVLAVIGAGALIALMALHRQRRLFLGDPQRRRFLLEYMQGGTLDPTQAAQRDLLTTIQRFALDASPTATPATAGYSAVARTETARAAEAIVYVDASGECTFANQAARELLHWRTGSLALRDMLAGGRGESDALLESLARRGLVEQHPSTLAGPTRAPLEINAVAVRDRDDNLWGAALFIRRAAAPGGLRPAR